MSLYGLLAWPDETLNQWVLDLQQRYGVASYGAPHLNMRAPFLWLGSDEELLYQTTRVLQRMPPFELVVSGWQRFDSAFYIGVEETYTLHYVHQKLVQIGGQPYGKTDLENYVPHITVALGVCPWARDILWEQLIQEKPPTLRWQVKRLALAVDMGGELATLHEFELGG